MNMDTEHTKYIRATVTRLNYLLNQDDNMKGLVIQVLNELSGSSDEELEQKLTLTASKMNFSQFTVISDRRCTSGANPVRTSRLNWSRKKRWKNLPETRSCSLTA